MSDQFINKVITIKEAGKVAVGEGYKMKVVADDGKTYGFFLSIKSTGADTVAHKNWKEMGLDVGKRVGISYVVSSYTGKDGSPRTSNDIRSFGDSDSIEFQGNEKQAPREAPIKDDGIWEAKDRLHAAQTALNAAATVYEGQQVDTHLLHVMAQANYNWLMRMKEIGEVPKDIPEPFNPRNQADEEEVENIPF